MKTKEFKHQFEPLTIPESKLPSKEEIGEAGMNWLREANVGFHPSVRLQWNACYEWLLQNGYIKI